MTLVEVIVASALIALLSIGIFSGVTQGVFLNNNTAQHTVAFGLCRERLEQMRGVSYASVSTNVFPNETLSLTHLGGFNRLPLTCTLVNTITENASPTRKIVSVKTEWIYKSMTNYETLYGVIYQKEGDALPVLRGDLGGSININPNNSPDNAFTMTTASGTITRDTLTQTYGGYSGPASNVYLKPKGNGNQNGLTVNGAPYSLENCSAYTITANNMNVVLRNDKVKNGKALGKWWIDITATDAIITTE